MTNIVEKLKKLTRAELAALQGHIVEKQPRQAPIVRAERGADTDLPLSFAQRRLWFLCQMEGVSEAYHIPLAYEVRGPLDVQVLRRALDELVARHESLRTAFVNVDGEPVQRILRADVGFPFSVEDSQDESDPAGSLAALIERHVTAPFDLRNSPLARACLVKRGHQDHVLLITMHHIVSDGWSIGVFVRELSELYACLRRGKSSSLVPLPVQYGDYAVWQQRALTSDALIADVEFWRAQLADAPVLLELPTDRKRPALQDYAGDEVPLTIGPELTAELKSLSQRFGVTLYACVLAGWAVVLSRLSGQQDLVIGTPAANRSRVELEGVIGCFVNTLPVRIDASGALSVAELLKQVSTAAVAAQDHQDLPFERIVELVHPVRSLAHTPLFQVSFAWQGGELEPLVLEGTSVRILGDRHPVAKFDLTLGLGEVDNCLVGALNYATALFDRTTIVRLAEYLRCVLSDMVSDSAKCLSSVCVLPGEERHKLLVEWNDTATPYEAERCIHELIEQRVAENPSSTAVIFEDQVVSYAELNNRANRLARYLRKLGVGPEGRVAICGERSPEMVVALLAILKAGGACLPLDPSSPVDRLSFMMSDAEVRVVLGCGNASAVLNAAVAGVSDEPPVIDVVADASAWAGESPSDLPAASIGLSSGHLAYVIYTSGSTGTPKGVMLEHRSLVNRFEWMRNAYGQSQRSCVLHKTPFTFDVSLWEIFGTLIVGAQLVIARPEGHRDPEYLAKVVREHRVTSLHFVPSMLRLFLEAESIGACGTLTDVFCGGEALPVELLRRFRERLGDVRLHNQYGPTEASIDVTAWSCPQLVDQDGEVSIGRPIQNARIYILDKSGQPVPTGTAGELCIGGVPVARGYLNRPELTAERFVPSPFVAGDRLYRTGDLARYLPNGDIEFLGRNDFQVKVRGFRIELGEIEAQLANAPGVQEAAVLAREDATGDKRLVAYYVADRDTDIQVEQLRSHLSASLPEYMVPAAYVRLNAMPVTTSGKLDRRALPAPDGDAYSNRVYEPPIDHLEKTLAHIWANVLGLEKVGRYDSFFELGGHSLLAMRVLDQMRRANLVADVRTIFATPVLAAFANVVRQATARNEVEFPPIPIGTTQITPDKVPLVSLTQEQIEHIASKVPGGALNIQDIYPLTPQQEGILFHHAMEKDTDPYLLTNLMRFDCERSLEAYVAALKAVIVRHDILRTSIVWEGLSEPVQVVWRQAPLVVERLSFSSSDGDIAAQLTTRVNPRRHRLDVGTAPLTRLFIGHDAVNDQWFGLQLIHHLIGDHDTAEALAEEIAAHMRGQSHALRTPSPFKNAVLRARDATEAESHESYFRSMLGTVEESTAPFDLRDVHGDGARIDEARHQLNTRLARRVRDCARQLGVSAASLLHVAWAQVVARTSGRTDVVFGTVLFGRTGAAAANDTALGPRINTLPVLVRLGAIGAAQAVRETHQNLTELLAHEHASLALAQRCSRVAAPAPLFTALLNYRHSVIPTRDEAAAQAALGVEYLGGEERTNYPIALNIDDLGEDFELTAQVSPEIDPQRVCAMMNTAIESLVEALEQEPSRAVATLSVLPPDERHKLLVEWNDTVAPYDAQRCIHELIEKHAVERPSSVALAFEGQHVSYADLNKRANRLARYLRRIGIGPDRRVAICVERSLEMVIGLLAIHKAGGAYVPLDPGYPTDRLNFMMSDAEVRAVLTHGPGRPVLDAALAGLPNQPPVIDLIADAPAWAGEDAADLPAASVGVTSRHLAYVIYTSGSTGKPKGVMVEHHSLVNRLAWMRDAYELTESSTALQKTPFTFDVSVWEIFGTLMVGARLVIARPGGHREPEYLARLIRDEQVASVHFVPSMLRLFLETASVEMCRTLTNVFCSGEELPVELVRRFRDRLGSVGLHNLYGPTEATVDVTAWTCPQVVNDDATVSIGRPIHNTRIYILDGSAQPVPRGMSGELCIGGVGVARGYLNRPDLTAERFISNPFVVGDRLYRTGDLARYLPSGDIQFLGRNDFQVKLRGFRIELGEIETQLTRFPGILAAVVLAREDIASDKRLVAYYVADAASNIEVEQLRAHLSVQLPEYMVPAAYVRLAELPMTTSGKLDRKALPAPDGDAYSNRSYEAPVGEVETTLASIWADVLGVETVGRHDNFFELGGHSLLAMRVLEQMRRANLVADVRELFATPVLAAFAKLVRQASPQRETEYPPIPTGTTRITPDMVPLVPLTQGELDHIASTTPGGAENIQDIYPLTPLQEGILFHHAMEKESDPYLLTNLMRFESEKSLGAYIAALEAAIVRHDILRTGVVWRGLTEPVQVVWRHAPLVVERLSFNPADGDVAAQLTARVNPRRHRLDVATAPLTRLFVGHDVVNDEWFAVQLIHHLIDDVTSLQVLGTEIAAHMRGQAHALPAPLPFKKIVLRARGATDVTEHEAFFRKMLGDVEGSTAPFGLLNVHGDGARIGEAGHQLTTNLARRVRSSARQMGVSAASLLHVAWAQVVARTAGRADAVFGTVLFGRTGGGEGTDTALGPFINTLPILVRLGAAGAAQGVRETHQTLTALMGHEHASLALAQRCSRVPPPAPLFTALLNYRHSVVSTLDEGGGQTALGVEYLGGEERTNYPLVLNIDDFGDAFELTAQVSPEIDPLRVCAMMATAIESLVDALEHDPARPLGMLSVLPPDERHKLVVEWNDTATPYDSESCIHELFEEQARRQPDALALVFAQQALSYRELNTSANRLARHLRSNGIERGSRVAICTERSPEMVVAMLAVLKAGGTYVPLDPGYPAQRLAFMLADSAPQVVLTNALGREAVNPALRSLSSAPAVLDLVADAPAWVNESSEDLPVSAVGLTSRQLAYVIYTSGSTGNPKGIRVAHSSVINVIEWINKSYDVSPRDCVLFVTSVSFDLSVYDVFGTLAAGAAVWIADADTLRDPERLADALLDERVTMWDSAPAALQMLVPFLEDRGRKNYSLRLVFNSGDWIPLSQPNAVKTHFPNASFVSLGGATEATIWSNYFNVHDVRPEWRSIPYGRPIQNARYYILDEFRQPVPIGVAGELYIAGACLAEGYTDPQLTLERFVEAASPDIAGPLYRTGDLARYWANGDIEFLGRNDFQVKIRGFRVELGEIEAQLLKFEGIRETVVLAREGVGGDKRLVAYYVPEHDSDIPVEQLRLHLASRLPEYMVPAAYVRLSEMPTTANGKLDRKALPAPDAVAYSVRPYEAPIGEVEVTLARIWAGVLGVEKVGRHDNFFELGGHSLLAMRVLEQMRREEFHADVRALFNNPVLADLAASMDGYGEMIV